MSKFYSYAMMAAMAMTSLGAFAANDGVNISLDPAPGVVTEFPAEITFKFEGPEAIAKNDMLGNPVRVKAPGSDSWLASTATWDLDNMSMTVKANPQLDRTLEGDYTVQLQAGGVMWVYDGVKTKCDVEEFTYSIAGDPVKITLNPDPAQELTEFPESFTMTFDGPDAIKKNITVSNPARVQAPGTDSWVQCTAVWTTGSNTLELKPLAALDRFIDGEYVVELRANGVTYVWPDGSTTKNEVKYFSYFVGGNGSNEDPGLTEVQYDIELIGTTPKLSPEFDASMRTLETLQLTFGAGGLKPADNATVTISGPNYKHSAGMKFSMGNEQATWMKANFPVDPEYNGTYTLTIPEGVVGNALWQENPELGHANAAVSMTFEVTGGKEWTGDEKQTTLNPIEQLPANGNKVETLNFIVLGFEEDVYYNEGLTFNVGFKADPQSMSFSNFGTATVTGSGNSVRLNIEPSPKAQGEYQLIIPEGSFRNAENAEEATNVNSELVYSYFLRPVTVEVKVLSTDPATDARVDGFAVGQGITIDTDANDAVAKMDLTIIEYTMDDESAMPRTILTASTTDKNAEGAICWIAKEDLALSGSCYYEVSYTLYDADDNKIYDGMYEFYGKDGFVGIDTVSGAETVKTVYNMQGMRLGSDINALPAGLYIINGKKVLIK